MPSDLTFDTASGDVRLEADDTLTLRADEVHVVASSPSPGAIELEADDVIIDGSVSIMNTLGVLGELGACLDIVLYGGDLHVKGSGNIYLRRDADILIQTDSGYVSLRDRLGL